MSKFGSKLGNNLSDDKMKKAHLVSKCNAELDARAVVIVNGESEYETFKNLYSK